MEMSGPVFPSFAERCHTQLLPHVAYLVQEQEPLIESLDRDTEGVSNRMSAAMHKLQEVIKKMNFCTQLGIIVLLMIVLIIMVWFTV